MPPAGARRRSGTEDVGEVFPLTQGPIRSSQGSMPSTGWIRGQRRPMAGARRRSGAEEGEAAPCAADVGEVFLPHQGEAA